MKKIFSLIAVVLISQYLFGQSKYLVYFKDKGEHDLTYFKKSNIYPELLDKFSIRAIERRKKVLGEEIFQYGDFPIYPPYLNQIEKVGIKIINRLNWFNAISCYLTEEQKIQVSELPFVKKIEKVKVFRSKNQYGKDDGLNELLKFNNDYGPSYSQLSLSEIPEVHSRGVTGNNVVIGLLDSGFRWKYHEAFQHLNVIAEFDFVFQDSNTENESEDHPSQDSHGTMILGIIGGKKDGKLLGSSYNSSFILAKTEDIRSETRVEEDNYAAALEWMEQLGVDVTSSSLGYSEFDDPAESYTYQDMNGQTTIVARAVDSAFVRGVVTVTSAGNEYNSPWKYIVSPADARYVLAIGAVQPDGVIAGFSSRGPTSDGRIKPDVCAQGTSVYTVQASTMSGYTYASGTSASAPIVAGIAALLISHYPEINQYQVRDMIRYTASQSDKPDTVYGWGIASAKKALSYPLLLRESGRVVLYKSFFKNTSIDSLRLLIYNDDGEQLLYNLLMTKVDSIKFKVELPVFLNDDDVYKLKFHYYSNRVQYSEPEVDGNFYSFQISSLKVFPPRSQMNKVENFILYQNYPNPVNGNTKFRFAIPEFQWVNFEIYDILGRKVRTLLKNVGLSKGLHDWLIWDGLDDNNHPVASGIYIYKLSSSNFTQTKKLILLRGSND